MFPSTTSFTPLATIHLPHPHLLHPDACNPAMDLVVLLDPRSAPSSANASILSRKGKEKVEIVGGTKVALWRMSGCKVWEIDVPGRVLGLAWTLDGFHLSLLILETPVPPSPATGEAEHILSIEHRSVHTGDLIRSVPFPATLGVISTEDTDIMKPTWWRMQWMSSGTEWESPRIGSSTSIIDSLPLVTPIVPTKPMLSHPFMLQNSAAAPSSSTTQRHPSLHPFPSLLPTAPIHPPDVLSINPPNTPTSYDLLTGTFPLPSHPQGKPSRAILRLADVANRLSGLLDVVLRGFESVEQAFREGNKQTIIWREEVETCAANEGLTNAEGHADLFRLLIAGRCGTAVNEWMGNRLTGRTVTKWELALETSFATIQKVISESVSPAIERIILLLEELRGWSLSYEYSTQLDLQINKCVRALDVAVGLAKVTDRIRQRAEHEQASAVEWFKWLKYEILRLQDTTHETVPLAVHDVKLTWSFLKNSFVSSVLLYNFPPETGGDESLPASVDHEPVTAADNVQRTVAETLQYLSSPCQRPSVEDMNTPPEQTEGDASVVTPPYHPTVDNSGNISNAVSAGSPDPDDSMNSLDTDQIKKLNMVRNVERRREEEPRLWCNSLLQACRTLIEDSLRAPREQGNGTIPRESGGDALVAERIVEGCVWKASLGHQGDAQTLYLAQILSSTHIRACTLPLSEQSLDCLALQFFDDVELALILDSVDETNPRERYLVTIDYRVLELQELDPHSMSALREGWTMFDLADALVQTAPHKLTLKRSRMLNHPGDSEREIFALALNGRKGRRVGCVMVGEGREIQVLDLEEDEDDVDDVDDDEEEEGGAVIEGEGMEGVEA